MIAKRFSEAARAALPVRSIASMRRPDDTPAMPDHGAGASKTRRKKDMHALQSLGEALVELEAARLAELDLPERLVDAIAMARTIVKHEARRRQMQYIGRLMRDVDAEPIRAALDRMRNVSRAAQQEFATAERWRDRLCTDDTALEAFVAEHPEVDRAELRELVLAARAERASGKPRHKYRALFRFVRAAQDAGRGNGE
jgi:ribosome-associated protein